MKLTKARDEYKNNLTTVERAKETIRAYTSRIELLDKFLAKRANGPVYLAEITTKDLQDFLKYMKEEKGWALKSLQQTNNILKNFFGYCFRQEWTEKDVSQRLEAIRVVQKEREYLTMEEMETLQEAIAHPIINKAVRTLQYTGLRINECLHLTVDDVDLKKGVIHVRNTKGKVDRMVPIHSKLKSLLEDYLIDRYLGTHKALAETNRFFATPKTGKLSACYVNQEIKKAVTSLGWKKQITAHNFRHSFASCLVSQGTSLVYIQKLLGHKDTRATSIYTHASPKELSEAINKLQ